MQRQETQITLEQFERIIQQPENRERRLELINGELVEKEDMGTEEHGNLILVLGAALLAYLRQNPIGHVTTDALHRADAINERRPDISLRLTDEPMVTQGSVPTLPDLAIEIQSPDDDPNDMRDKAHFYLQNGSKAVWLLYPRKQIIETYHNDPRLDDILTANEVLTGGDLLPGFSVPVRDVFEG